MKEVEVIVTTLREVQSARTYASRLRSEAEVKLNELSSAVGFRGETNDLRGSLETLLVDALVAGNEKVVETLKRGLAEHSDLQKQATDCESRASTLLYDTRRNLRLPLDFADTDESLLRRKLVELLLEEQ